MQDGLDPVSIALLSGNLDIARLFVLKHILDKVGGLDRQVGE